MDSAVIDRFEEDYAVLLVTGTNVSIQVLRQYLPKDVYKGDHLIIELRDGEIVQVERDEHATEQARLRIQAKLDRLRRGDHLTG